MKILKNKNIIVTGATRGIGKGIVTLFAKQGANIAFTYLSSDSKAKELEDELRKYDTKIIINLNQHKTI